MTGHSPQIVELTEAMNAREHVLTALVDTYVAWQALRARQSGDREVGDRETALFSQREFVDRPAGRGRGALPGRGGSGAMTKQKTAAKLSAVRIRWHEASHTVIARAAGLRVLVVTARGGRLDKYRGTTTLAPRPETTPQQFHENEIKVLLAGMLGEAKHFPELDLQLDIMPYCASDWATAYHHAHKLALIGNLPQPKRMNIQHIYPATIDLIDGFATEVEGLLNAHWPAIGRLAKALHSNESLTTDAIDAVIAGGRPQRSPREFPRMNHA